jgi:lantibiotic modifying enzyme
VLSRRIMTSFSWTPILSGDAANRAMEAVDAIARDPRVRASEGGDGDAAGASLAGGTAGRALLYSYLAACDVDAAAAEDVALEQLESSLTALEEVRMSASLHEGFAGIAWTHAHLAGRLFERDDDTSLAAIDEALLDYLSQTPWTDDYDLISGLVGLGVYALEHAAEAMRDALATRIVARLSERAERHDDRAAWFTGPAMLSPPQLEQAPNGFYNLGMAHGIPAVVAWLGLVTARAVECDAGRLVEGAVDWLRAQERPPDEAAAFSHWLEPGKASAPARLAWCYGDPGVAIAMLSAARGAARRDWEADALRIARRAAHRSRESSGVRDAGLCHGAAGVAHVFNRLYQATGEAWLADAARAWFARTLEMRQPGGVGGFLAYTPAPQEHWIAETGLLTGAAGIALALLAACTSIEPEWDRVLLLDVD